MSAAEDLGGRVGVAPACRGLGASRATLYRRRAAQTCPRPQQPRPRPARALEDEERQAVLDVLHEERFVDLSPLEVYAILLDEGRYLCSARTMYRILAAAGAVRERRNQLRHPAYTKPELLATGPNQVWSWDITKLKGPVKWSYYYLYVVLDIYSRRVVGWTLADCESIALAKELIEQTCEKEGIDRDQLTIHADRGPSMTSKVVAFLYADLGVTKSHSRPYTSNDNPFSESAFRTLKYRPEFPARFGWIEDARALPRFLRLVQRRASPLEPRSDDARHRALRPRRSGLRHALDRARRRVPRASRALRAPCADAAGTADRNLDQPAGQGEGRGTTGCSLNSNTRCLRSLTRPAVAEDQV